MTAPTTPCRGHHGRTGRLLGPITGLAGKIAHWIRCPPNAPHRDRDGWASSDTHLPRSSADHDWPLAIESTADASMFTAALDRIDLDRLAAIDTAGIEVAPWQQRDLAAEHDRLAAQVDAARSALAEAIDDMEDMRVYVDDRRRDIKKATLEADGLIVDDLTPMPPDRIERDLARIQAHKEQQRTRLERHRDRLAALEALARRSANYPAPCPDCKPMFDVLEAIGIEWMLLHDAQVAFDRPESDDPTSIEVQHIGVTVPPPACSLCGSNGPVHLLAGDFLCDRCGRS